MKLLTIITPVKNSIDSVRQTIESVIDSNSAMLIKHVVIDGGSEDGTLELLQSYGSVIHLYSIIDNSIAEAMNYGARFVDTPFYMILDADDQLQNQHIAALLTQLKLKLETGDASITCCSAKLVCSDPAFSYIHQPPIPINLTKGMEINHTATIFPANVLKHAKYNESLKITADWEFCLNLQIKGFKFESSPIILTHYAIGGVTCRQSELTQQENKAIRRSYNIKTNPFQDLKLWIFRSLFKSNLTMVSHMRRAKAWNKLFFEFKNAFLS